MEVLLDELETLGYEGVTEDRRQLHETARAAIHTQLIDLPRIGDNFTWLRQSIAELEACKVSVQDLEAILFQRANEEWPTVFEFPRNPISEIFNKNEEKIKDYCI